MMRTPDIAVIGGGLLGRLLAWRAARAGLAVSLYEAGSRLGESSAAWAAAGMLTPAAEAADADAEIVSMGRHSLTLWSQWLADLPAPVFFRADGSLLVWHREDAGEAVRFERKLMTRDAQADLRRLDRSQLAETEPLLGDRFPQAFYLPKEAQIDNRELLAALALALEESGVDCHWNTKMDDSSMPAAHTLVDCRGMGARQSWAGLRGVRGEIARLSAPELELRHMVRLLHPRYSVYMAPRANGGLIVGATNVESDDTSPVSVRGALELLSSAYSVLPALAEARILELTTQVRPALSDNRPAFAYDRSSRTLRINGLYRHGFLLGPAVVEEALNLLTVQEGVSPTARWSCLAAGAEQYRQENQSCLSS